MSPSKEDQRQVANYVCSQCAGYCDNCRVHYCYRCRFCICNANQFDIKEFGPQGGWDYHSEHYEKLFLTKS